MYNAQNPLGITKAVLKEFTIFKPEEKSAVFCKLYKTDEGNWYDPPVANSVNALLLTFIKMAIDDLENENSFQASA